MEVAGLVMSYWNASSELVVSEATAAQVRDEGPLQIGCKEPLYVSLLQGATPFFSGKGLEPSLCQPCIC